MPSKGHRAASRQGQLNRKKRRGKGQQRPGGAPVPPASTTIGVLDEDQHTEQEEETVVAEPETVQPEPPPTPQRGTRRADRLASSEATRAYSYLGGELRQISLITSLIVIILTALMFVLGR